MKLEKMSSFFNKRVDSYEDHMMNNVDGANIYYKETSKLINKLPDIKILDLGCGTGLEIDEIFKVNPTAQITGIDLSVEMINKLKNKHLERIDQLHLIEGNYLELEFGDEIFDVALSVQTMHHFTYMEKVKLYKKVYLSLKDNKYYIETDYMAPNQEYEDFYFAEFNRICNEQGFDKELYHYDTPCTVENQINMLLEAGFKRVEKVWHMENTVILIAYK
jgi:tRNA (cmo5U34)-methyltransferase